MKVKGILKRVSSFILALVITFTTVISGVLGVPVLPHTERYVPDKALVTVMADSNDRRATLIHMAAGMNASGLNDQHELTITKEELQVIGIFLSNFYKPFQTCVNATDSDINKKLEEEEIQCLVDVGFDEEIAQYLVKAVKKASSSTATNDSNKLTYQYKYVTSQEINTKIDNPKDIKTLGAIDCSYAIFVNAATQGGVVKYGDKVIIDFGVGYNAKRKVVDVAGFDDTFDRVLPSTVPGSTQLMLQHLYNMLDWKNGYGTSIIYSLEDTLSNKDFAATLANVSSSEFFERVIPSGQLLYLDCFGNIIADMGTAQVVVVPACMNPYVFQAPDDETAVTNPPDATTTESTTATTTDGATDDEDAAELGQYTGTTHSVYNCANLQTMYGRNAVGSGKNKDFDFSGGGAFYDTFFRKNAYWSLVPNSTEVTFTTKGLTDANDKAIKVNDLLTAVPGFSASYRQKESENGKRASDNSKPVVRDVGSYVYFQGKDYGLDPSKTSKIVFPTWCDSNKGDISDEIPLYQSYLQYTHYGKDWVSEVLFIDDPATMAEFVDPNADVEETNESSEEETSEEETSEEETSEEGGDAALNKVTSPLVGVSATGTDDVMKELEKEDITGYDITTGFDKNNDNVLVVTVKVGNAVFNVDYDPNIQNWAEKSGDNGKFVGETYARLLHKAIDVYNNDKGSKAKNPDSDPEGFVKAVKKVTFKLQNKGDSYNAYGWLRSVAGVQTSVGTDAKDEAEEEGKSSEESSEAEKEAIEKGNEQIDEQTQAIVTDGSLDTYSNNNGAKDTSPALETKEGSVNEDGSINFTLTNIYNLQYNNYVSVSLTSSKDDFYSNLKSGGAAYSIYIFLAYVYGYANYKNSTFGIQNISYQLNLGGLPDVDVGNVFDGLEIDNTNQLTLEVLSLAKYWMHPKEGKGVITTWVNNKVSAILVSIHEKVMGSNMGNVSTATSKYLSFSGYVTMPELDDLAWTNAILNKYDSMSVFIIILIFVILLGYSMIGRIDVFKALLNTVIFAFCLALPPMLIDGAIAYTNKVSDALYGSKFMYWGLTQHESYIQDMNQAAADGDYDAYINTVFKQRVQDTSSKNFGSAVRLKWMCPKKDNYVQNIKEQVANDTGSKLFGNIVGAMSNKAGITAEEYTDDNNALYLYRSYTDIANYSRYTYLTTSVTTGPELSSLDGETLGNYRNNYVNYLGSEYNSHTAQVGGHLAESEDKGFNYKPISGDFGHRIKLFNGNVQMNTLANSYSSSQKIIDSANLSTYMGMPTKSFKTLAQIRSADNPDVQDAALNAYSQLSESPFYFFSWNLYDQGMNAVDDNASEGFKCLVLNESMSNANTIDGGAVEEGTSEEATSEASTEATTEATDNTPQAAQMGDKTNDGYFFNLTSNQEVMKTEAWGEMRDYMDMKSLFTVVIPYLKGLNDAVINYDTAFGLKTFDGYSYNPDDSANYTESQDQKMYWQNVCTAQMFNMYTPWVDTMYDCKYAQGEQITYLGHKYTITDPLNPDSYINAEVPNGVSTRPMVFSKSEMRYYGLKEKDLTAVEQKILQVEENSYKELYKLMNYYTFHDSVVNTAAAMIETFEFNKVFSQDRLVGESYVLYPQAYELKNFSYDAFLRLILSQATGEELMTASSNGESIYERVVENSNLFCGIGLLINDVICCWLVPLAKFAFLVLVFILSLVMMLSTVIKLEVDNMRKVIFENLITPLAQFLLYTIGHAWLINCFMSEGNTAVTGSTATTITLGDPTITVLLMAIVNGLLVVLFTKVVLKLLRATVKYIKAVGSDLVAMGGGVIGGLASAVGGVTSGIGGKVAGVGGAVGGAMLGAGAVGAAALGGLGYLGSKAINKVTTAKTKKKEVKKEKGENPIDKKIREAGKIGDGSNPVGSEPKTKAQKDKEEAQALVNADREKRKHNEEQYRKVSREKQEIEHKQKRAKDNVNNAKFDNNGGLKRLDGESDAQYKQRALLVASRRSGKNEDGTLNTDKMNKILKNSGYSDEESKKLCEKIKKSYDKKHKSGNSREKAKADSKRNTAVDVKPSTIVGGAKNKRVSEFTDKKGSRKKDRKSKRLKRKEKMNKTNNK